MIPWLAQSYSASPDLKTYSFELRSGIQFADGEQLNSTAVYFSLNRELILDGSTPSGHGTQASWILQQLLNTSLSTLLCGCAQTYNQNYANAVLGENFVQPTGSLNFTMHVMTPNAAFQDLFAIPPADILAPEYVMQHDLALWNQSSAGYSLPYSTLTGNLTNQIREYFFDEVATCNHGVTPSGCGTTYFDGSFSGSKAGTGPYTIQSFGQSTDNMVLQANPSYWGGPYQFFGGNKIVPRIATIKINFVPDLSTRELDLKSAAASGQAMTVDVPPDHLYDIADRAAWQNNGTLRSIIPGVSVYGPYTSFSTLFDPFGTNVSNPISGSFYQFQPFSDIRFRLAFADAVNLTQINLLVNNKLGQVAINVVPPGMPPAGSYNISITPRYSYDLTAVQNLLVDAMTHPVTTFNFENGTLAPSGFFNNTFGCLTLNSAGQCNSPVGQTITLVYPIGDTVDQTIFSTIASAVNNVSSTYNMGLTVSVVPVPVGTEVIQAFTGRLYMYSFSWVDDYPFILDFLGPLLTPGQALSSPSGWNLAEMGTLYQQAVNASSHGDNAGVVRASNAMTELANQEVMSLWIFYPLAIQPMTSNVQGYYFNPALYSALATTATPEYFAALY